MQGHLLHVHIIREIGGSGRCILEPNGASPALLHATLRGRERTWVRADSHTGEARIRGHGRALALRQARG
jgi:hypothetical protein